MGGFFLILLGCFAGAYCKRRSAQKKKKEAEERIYVNRKEEEVEANAVDAGPGGMGKPGDIFEDIRYE